jgi:hypothetical protein
MSSRPGFRNKLDNYDDTPPFGAEDMSVFNSNVSPAQRRATFNSESPLIGPADEVRTTSVSR